MAEVLLNPSPGRRLIGVCLAVILAGCLFRLGLVWGHPIGEDERQHVHFAWCINQGLTPYSDFWDNHPPLFHSMLAPLMDWTGADPGFFPAARLMMQVWWVGALILTGLIGRQLGGAAVGWVAVALLAVQPAFLWKMTEIRPDGPLVVTVLLALWVLLSDRASRLTIGRSFFAGLILGAGFCFSTKAIIAGASFGLATGCVGVGSFRRGGLIRTFLDLGAMIGGSILCPAVWLGLEAMRGNAWRAINSTFFENIGYGDRFSPFAELSSSGVIALLIIAAIAALTPFRAAVWTTSGDVRRVVPIFTIAMLIVYLVVMPAPYLQSALPFVPLLCAIVAVIMVHVRGNSDAAAGQIKPVSFLIIGLGILYPLILNASALVDGVGQYRRDIQQAFFVHELIPEGSRVIDGHSIATFRSHAIFHPSLVRGITMLYARDPLFWPVKQQMEQIVPDVLFLDSRVARMGAHNLEVLETYFETVVSELNLGLPIAPVVEWVEGGLMADVLMPGAYVVWRAKSDGALSELGSDVIESRSLLDPLKRGNRMAFKLKRGVQFVAVEDAGKDVLLVRIPGTN